MRLGAIPEVVENVKMLYFSIKNNKVEQSSVQY